MTKSIYIITGVLALSITGTALSQERDRGMSMMDTDGNGTVEKSEFVAMYEKRFGETDTDGGGISLDEYKAKVVADRAERDARRAERREERAAEKEEKRAAREENKEERDAKRAERDAKRTQERFESLDADGNGSVSAEEYQAAGDKMFDRMDRDGDGILNDRRGRGRGDGNRRGPRPERN